MFLQIQFRYKTKQKLQFFEQTSIDDSLFSETLARFSIVRAQSIFKRSAVQTTELIAKILLSLQFLVNCGWAELIYDKKTNDQKP